MTLFAWVGGRTFASLRKHRNFRLYFVSHAVVRRSRLVTVAFCTVLVLSTVCFNFDVLLAPDHLRGQATGLYYFAFQGGAPLGGLLAGWLTARGGTPLAFAVAGTVAVTVAIAGAVALMTERPAWESPPSRSLGA